jgi:serine/threonine-protein kinase
MAPEQAMGRKDIGPWTDIWAMGVVLFESLTGRYPFDFSAEMAFTGILLTIVSAPARSLAEVWPDAPSHLVLAIDRALAKDPTQRWPSMTALRAAVEAAPLSQQETAYAPPVQVAPAPLPVAPQLQGAFPSAGSVVLTGTLPHGDTRPPQRSLLPWIGAAVAVAAGVGVVAAIGLANSAPPIAGPTTQPTTTAIETPDASTLTVAAPVPTTPPQVPTTPLHDRHPAEHVVPPSTLAHEMPPPPAPPALPTPPVSVTPPVAPNAPETTPTAEADPPEEPSTPREGTSMRRDPTPTMQGSWGTTVSAEDM